MNVKLSVRAALLATWDVLAVFAAFVAAVLTTWQDETFFANTDWLFVVGIAAITAIAVFAALKLYNNLWEYAGLSEFMQIVYGTIVAVAIAGLIHFVADTRLPIRVYLIAWVILLVLVGVARVAFLFWRRFRHRFRHNSIATFATSPLRKVPRPRTLVVGAGESGSLTIDQMTHGSKLMQGDPIVAVDDDVTKHKMRIHKVQVVGGTDMILDLVKTYEIEQIVVAIPTATPKQRKRIYDICIQTDCHLLTLPNIRELRMEDLKNVRLREVNLADLLSRDEVVLDERRVGSYLTGKKVLITGGGGSIGSELARQIATVAPEQIVIFDIYENTAYELEIEMRDKYPGLDLVVEIGSVRDADRLDVLFVAYKPNVVFHAAAHKHVPLMEVNPREAILNNVFGTLSTVQAAHTHKVERFVFISTDKAVNPSSVMGATKRLGELIIQHFAQISATCFTAVRFGNVLGSHGSVIPMFNRQIANGGPVTVTSPDVSRYFMTIPEASRLVLQAGSLAYGGEIFILEMGEQVKITDLAAKVIRLSGLVPDVDIKIEYVGLRRGEKLVEELLMDSESVEPTAVKGVLVSKEGLQASNCENFLVQLESLRDCLDEDNYAIIACLAKQVPTFASTNSR